VKGTLFGEPKGKSPPHGRGFPGIQNLGLRYRTGPFRAKLNLAAAA